jgi:hypothetical protein
MPVCTQVHEIKNEAGQTEHLQHEYYAGLCVHAHSDSTVAFLKAHYPYYHGLDYDYSRQFHPTDLEYGV